MTLSGHTNTLPRLVVQGRVFEASLLQSGFRQKSTDTGTFMTEGVILLYLTFIVIVAAIIILSIAAGVPLSYIVIILNSTDSRLAHPDFYLPGDRWRRVCGITGRLRVGESLYAWQT